MFPTLIIYLTLAFCGVAGFAFAILHLLVVCDARTQDRIDEAARQFNPTVVKQSKFLNWINERLFKIASFLLIDRGESGSATRSRLVSRLRFAGYYGPSAQSIYVAMTILLATLPSVIAAVLALTTTIETALAVWISFVGGACGMLVPSFWLDRQKARRHLVLLKSLPDFLDLMITCLASGLSLESALKRVSSEIGNAHPQLSAELARVQHEINLGSSVDQALLSFAQRCDCDEIRSLASLCQQARQYGTRISDALRAHADLMRTKRELKAEERAQKAVVKILMPTMLLIFPSVFVVMAGPAAIQIWESFGSPDDYTTNVSSSE